MRAAPVIFMVVVALSAQEAVPHDPLESLVRDSPFVPAAGTARSSASDESGPLEFRSVVFEGETFFFSIYDQGSRESKWVTLGQQDDLPFVARSYNQEEDVLTVEHGGRTLALKLQPAQTGGQGPTGGGPVPSPLPSPEEASRPGGASPANPEQPAPAPPTSSLKPDESQRLQEMADEIRRRRQQPVQPSRN